MNLERKKDLSVYYWTSNLFSAYSFITVEDDYPTSELTLPTIAVIAKPLRIEPNELGNRKGIRKRIWFIEIFAKNKSQRDDYAYEIIDNLENYIPVYNYDEGFPPSVTPSQLGVLKPYNLEYIPVKVDSRLVDTLYWRGIVSFLADYTQT